MSDNDELYNSPKLRALFEAKRSAEENMAKDNTDVQRKIPNSITDVSGVNYVGDGAGYGGLSGSIKPYGEVLDEMEHEAKYKPHPVEHLIALLREALTTMNHARVFISTRERMHPIGVGLYDDLVNQIEGALTSSTVTSHDEGRT